MCSESSLEASAARSTPLEFSRQPCGGCVVESVTLAALYVCTALTPALTVAAYLL